MGGKGGSDAHTCRGNFEGKNGPDQVDILRDAAGRRTGTIWQLTGVY